MKKIQDITTTTHESKIGFIATVLISAHVWAVPTLYPESINYSLRNNTSSNIVADSTSSRRYYVMPPNAATATASGLQAVTANVGFCQELSEIQKYNLETVKMMNDVKIELVNLRKQSIEQNAFIKKIRIEMSQFVTANNLLELSQLDQTIDNLQKNLNSLYDKSNVCESNCAVILQDIQKTMSLRSDLQRQRTEITLNRIAQTNEYEKRKAVIQSLNDDYDQNINRTLNLQSQLTKMYKDFLSMYDIHSQREGGRASFDYNSHWSDNVSRLQYDNPTYQFEKIQTQNAIIKADAYQNLASLPGGSVLAFSIAGVKAKENISFAAYPEAFNSTATLNLLAVCPILYPRLFGFEAHDPMVDPQKMKYGLTVSFDYPSEVRYDLKVNYNMYKMYELIKSQGQEGGFFGSHTWSETDEKTVFQDSFKVEWIWTTPTPWLTASQQLNIETDIRRQMLSRLGAMLAVKSDGALFGAAASTNEAPQAGALVLSQSLAAACPQNAFCRGASIALNVLHSIFSSSSMSDSYKNQINVDMSERYVNHQIQMQNMLTSYR